MSKIFFSYRRSDSAGHTGRLYDSLRDKFGEDSVFRDIENLDTVGDFVDALDQALDKCDLQLVIIGDEWISSSGSKGRRLDQPDDFVRMEIAKALDRKIPVVPVLVAGAVMPGKEELPEDLHGLCRQNAIEISDTRWSYDVGRLCDAITKVLGLQVQASKVETRQAASDAATLQNDPAERKKGRGMFGKLSVAIAGVITLAIVISFFTESDQTTDLMIQPEAEMLVSGTDNAAPASLSTYKIAGLTWTTNDRKKDIDWNAAYDYCENLKINNAEGYSDWRLPTINELELIYDPDDVDAFDKKIMRPFHNGVTSNYIWSSEKDTSSAVFAFNFIDGSEVSLAVNFDEGAHGLCVSGALEY